MSGVSRMGDRLSNPAFGCRYADVESTFGVSAVTDRMENGERFEELFTAHYTALARLIYRVAGDTAIAEELAAEAFWRLYKNPPASRDNIAGWLYRTGLRLALDHLRMRKRRAHYEALAPAVRGADRPDETLEHRERQSRIRQVLAAMKPEQAALLVLRSEGHSLKEIASLLYLNPTSVGTLLARAEAAFRKEYVSRYGEC
jgi:RNA polymerase sigma-70 factor (ECF subfamily)